MFIWSHLDTLAAPDAARQDRALICPADGRGKEAQLAPLINAAAASQDEGAATATTRAGAADEMRIRMEDGLRRRRRARRGARRDDQAGKGDREARPEPKPTMKKAKSAHRLVAPRLPFVFTVKKRKEQAARSSRSCQKRLARLIFFCVFYFVFWYRLPARLAHLGSALFAGTHSPLYLASQR